MESYRPSTHHCVSYSGCCSPSTENDVYKFLVVAINAHRKYNNCVRIIRNRGITFETV